MVHFNDEPWVEAGVNSPNFMTPQIIERGRSGDWAWEISRGRGFEDEPIYGCTFLWWEEVENRWIKGHEFDLDENPSKMVRSYQEAKEHVQQVIKDG